jgi:hypothetical protein
MNKLIEHELAEMENAAPDRFKIDSPDKANWALRKIRAYKAKIAETRELARAEIDRILAWEGEEVKGPENDIAFLEGLLAEYHRELLDKDPDAKTIKLPYGTLLARAQQPLFHRHDFALIEWAQENDPELVVQQDPILDWAGLKKKLIVQGEIAINRETGEAMPGITVEHRPPKFTVKINDGQD